MTISLKTGWLKSLACFGLIFLVRLLPFRPANFEPLLATLMPLSKRFGYLNGFLFGFFSIVLYDAVTSGIGMWTLATAGAYGLLGVGSYFYFKKRKATRKNFLLFGVVGTILYDILTGFSVGPLFFHQALSVAIVGQIPFTLMHLLGTIVFTLALSPALYRWFAKEEVITFSIFAKPALADVSKA